MREAVFKDRGREAGRLDSRRSGVSLRLLEKQVHMKRQTKMRSSTNAPPSRYSAIHCWERLLQRNQHLGV